MSNFNEPVSLNWADTGRSRYRVMPVIVTLIGATALGGVLAGGYLIWKNQQTQLAEMTQLLDDMRTGQTASVQPATAPAAPVVQTAVVQDALAQGAPVQVLTPATEAQTAPVTADVSSDISVASAALLPTSPAEPAAAALDAARDNLTTRDVSTALLAVTGDAARAAQEDEAGHADELAHEAGFVIDDHDDHDELTHDDHDELALGDHDDHDDHHDHAGDTVQIAGLDLDVLAAELAHDSADDHADHAGHDDHALELAREAQAAVSAIIQVANNGGVTIGDDDDAADTDDVVVASAALSAADQIRLLTAAATAPQTAQSDTDARDAARNAMLSQAVSGIRDLSARAATGNYEFDVVIHENGEMHPHLVLPGLEDEVEAMEVLLVRAATEGVISVPDYVVEDDGQIDTEVLMFALIQRELASGTAAEQAEAERLSQRLQNFVQSLNPTETLEPDSTYTVVSGDSLALIALQFYGDTNQYQRIFDANRDILTSPERIQIGQRLRIPNA